MSTMWTPGARADLVELVQHIQQERPAAARKLARRIRAMVREASVHPELGRIVPEFGRPSIRERVVRPYRVVYLVEDQRIVVLGVVHGRRRMPSALQTD